MHAVERAIARIAGRQDNVITHDQLLAAGLDPRRDRAPDALGHACSRQHRACTCSGRRHRPRWPGPGPRPSPADPTPWSATAQPPAFSAFCQRSAGDVDVTVAGRNPGIHRGIRLHRVGTLAKSDVTVMSGSTDHHSRPHDLRPRRHRVRPRHRTGLPGGSLPRDRHRPRPRNPPRARAEPEGRTGHPGADQRPTPNPLRARATTAEADQSRPAPQAAHERPSPRLQGRYVLAVIRPDRRI